MKFSFKINIFSFMLASIISLSAMEKQIPTSFLEILPQDLKNQIELIKFISQTPYETIDQAIEIVNSLRKLPRFSNIIDEPQITNLIINSIASKLKLYQESAFAIANKLNTPSALQWIEKRKAEIPLEEKFIYAAIRGEFDKINEFLNQKVNINAQNQAGVTSLMYSSMRGNLPIVNKLLNTPAIDINLQAIDGDTALILASLFGNSEIVKMLLEAGADWTIKNKSGKTALDIAREQGHPETIWLLDKAAETK